MAERSRKRNSSAVVESNSKRRFVPDSDEDEDQDASRVPSPLPEESQQTFPEVVLKSFYKKPGVLLIAGCVSWDNVAKRDSNGENIHPNLYTFHKFTDRKYRLIVSGCDSGHSILVSTSGECYTFGRNNYGQLGLGDTTTRYVPELVPELTGKNIIHAATGKHHSLFVTDTGTVYACGDNKHGQLGIGNNTPQYKTPTRIRYKGPPVVKAGCGSNFSMILDCNGALHSFGLPEFGQLGHNTDGKYFMTSNRLAFNLQAIPKKIAAYFEKQRDGRMNPITNVEIVDFSCGNNHTVAIDSLKRVFSWGFGGYGRLGHSDPKDVAVPLLIRSFQGSSRGVKSVYCGSKFTLAVNELGMLYLFGQPKPTGEANMYPKPMQDLMGWNVQCMGAGHTSMLFAADDTLIAMGASPTYGELGLGFTCGSTTRAKEVYSMAGMKYSQIAMGYSHSMLLVDDSTDEVKQKLEAIPTYSP
ncbi:protein RCC2 homolog [Leptidea sinapis]|uniref:Protein RCC2 homolog n=1 Tax=Leptidea sinapis TaxID=189913 RepID=A0A5E4PMP9_9NEOP|nr:protein RCC2 homolog [Leptidea sinapis]VVC86344.1 unnamed protein product [Leptidea sinapis]